MLGLRKRSIVPCDRLSAHKVQAGGVWSGCPAGFRVGSGFREVRTRRSTRESGGLVPGPEATAGSHSSGLVRFTQLLAKIYIANANGSSRRQLTYGYQPDWQRLS